jgi:hypothetical protein
MEQDQSSLHIVGIQSQSQECREDALLKASEYDYQRHSLGTEYRVHPSVKMKNEVKGECENLRTEG